MKEKVYYFGKVILDLLRLIVLYMNASSRRKYLDSVINQGLDYRLIPVLEYILLNKLSDTDKMRVRRIEQVRSALAARGGREKVEIFYSPKPGSAGNLDQAVNRPQHGEKKHFSIEWIANLTSKYKYWGTILYLFSNYFEAKTILELGACAGISGAYMLSGEHCRRFITIEASRELASLAEDTLGKLNHKKSSTVLNCLFDDGLDLIIKQGNNMFDMVYIDGHHEKVATLHYFNRIVPLLNIDSLIVFDDIYWSDDMYEAWKIIRNRSGFSLCVDLGEFGLCVWNGTTQSPVQLNLNSFTTGLSRWRPRQPHGWK